MNHSFLRLSPEKRNTIEQAALEEFAEWGFDGASTNRIVQSAGISKGSLFKYFSSKEDLYLHLVDITMKQVIPVILEKSRSLPTDITQRVVLLSENVIDIYIANPLYYRLFMGMLDSGARKVQAEILHRYAENLSFLDLFTGVDNSRFRLSGESVFRLIRWLFAGIKQELFELTSVQQDPAELKRAFMAKLDEVVELLRHGIYS